MKTLETIWRRPATGSYFKFVVPNSVLENTLQNESRKQGLMELLKYCDDNGPEPGSYDSEWEINLEPFYDIEQFEPYLIEMLEDSEEVP